MRNQIESEGLVVLGNINAQTFVGRDQVTIINIHPGTGSNEEVVTILKKALPAYEEGEREPLINILTKCFSDYEVPYTIRTSNEAVVKLATETLLINTIFQVDDATYSFEYNALLAKLNKRGQKAFAEYAIRNPSRGITPILSENLAIIRGFYPRLPSKTDEVREVVLDAFGRINTYVREFSRHALTVKSLNQAFQSSSARRIGYNPPT